MTTFESIHAKAEGRWRSILPALGVPREFLTGKHVPCPACGGKDRFRFDDKGGLGTFFCAQCGAGKGVDLVMRVNGIEFTDAVKLIERELPHSTVQVKVERRQAGDAARWVSQWKAAAKLDGDDPASRYLASRGLDFGAYPPTLRYMPGATYTHADKRRERLPAMAAIYASSDKDTFTVHYTFLDREGQKAKLDPAKKLAPCPVPKGGAVRLCPAGEDLGIAEGIETAESARRIFGVPTWAALDAGKLQAFRPPLIVKRLWIFGDNDSNCVGQAAAWSLAHRLKIDNPRLEVRVEIPERADTDWNDVLCQG